MAKLKNMVRLMPIILIPITASFPAVRGPHNHHMQYQTHVIHALFTFLSVNFPGTVHVLAASIIHLHSTDYVTEGGEGEIIL